MTAARALRESLRRELGWLRRDRWDFAMATWWPAAMLALIAFVFVHGVPRDLPIAVVDQDRSALSRELLRRLDAAPGIAVAVRANSLDHAWEAVRSRRVWAVVNVPENSSRDLARERVATLPVWFNASYPTAGQAAEREIAAVARTLGLRMASGTVRPPLSVQTSFLANPARSYEHFLVGLVFPALLHLAACLAMVAALGRELRDGSAAAWLAASGGRVVPALAGKLLPYLIVFQMQGIVALAWIDGVRGGGIVGSFALLALGLLLMFAAYAGIALLLVGATRNLGTALSMTGLYAGTSLAFSGATFPTREAPLFTQVWTHLLPFTAYLKLQAKQRDLDAAWAEALPQLAALTAFVVLGMGVGGWLYAKAARDPSAWGRR